MGMVEEQLKGIASLETTGTNQAARKKLAVEGDGGAVGIHLPLNLPMMGPAAVMEVGLEERGSRGGLTMGPNPLFNCRIS